MPKPATKGRKREAVTSAAARPPSKETEASKPYTERSHSGSA